MAVTKFPSNPFDGMKFTDQWRRRWIFDGSRRSWEFEGLIPDIPVADQNTIGLLSPELKILLDGTHEKGGGFGIFTKQSFGKVAANGHKGVLNGDVKIISDSLNITCEAAAPQPELGIFPKIDINIKDDFLDTTCVEVPGCKGQKGKKGDKGDRGAPGTGDGPSGVTGAAGEDATGVSTVSATDIEFVDGFFTSAITQAFLSDSEAILSVTRSDAIVPDENTPAVEVTALGLPRDIEFVDDDTFDYQIVRPPGTTDPIESLLDNIVLGYGIDFDPNVNTRIKVAADGCCCEERDEAEVIAVRLSSYIDDQIAKFQIALNEAEEGYDREIKEFIFKKDEEARKALDVLVQKLSHEEFTEGFQYCMNLADNGICGQQCCNELSRMRQDPYNNPNNRLGDIAEELEGISDKINCLCDGGDATAVLASGNSPIASEISNNIVEEYGIPSLSQNISAFQVVGSDSATAYDIFTVGICRFVSSLLTANGFANAEEYCPDSNSKSLGTIVIEAGEQQVVSSDVGASMKSGAIVFQYIKGTVYDSDNPVCGYVVGTGGTDLGLVIRLFRSNPGTGQASEVIIPWPQSSLNSNPLNPDEVEEAYSLGPITENAVAIIVDDGDRVTVEAAATGDKSSGAVELAISHCSQCVILKGAS